MSDDRVDRKSCLFDGVQLFITTEMKEEYVPAITSGPWKFSSGWM